MADSNEMAPGRARREVKECVRYEVDVPAETIAASRRTVAALPSAVDRPRLAGVTDAGVPGFLYLPHYLSAEEQSAVLAAIEGDTSVDWSDAFETRLQKHWGWAFVYECGQIVGGEAAPPAPALLLEVLAERFVADGLVATPPNQVLANKYMPGNGIGYHVDRIDLFGDVIIGVNLVVPTKFTLKSVAEPEERVSVVMAPGSVYVLSGEARFGWRHGITRKARLYKRFRRAPELLPDEPWRVSLTFRDVLEAT
ncbi:2OG-Fe(II) oxygenase family Oxidoreductase [Thecamonas trahens ATCC 50062]|uniref:2OG-Fe(II) oxygenase family Oxidoreductase n=1 Tax=Thecamonas trahens ATCC 50062 TaxID=461836 RepID=A0A0L0DQX9_THETB|nr:2OG-Fe(II) oxygenase family Oxidoreductase [Thecamonas trahens ATCC 50062]KNC54709.1 2OG-Fe(II) oxygenase family Oxidoreductase [Thecamonas trahens ATCC 50062]|eukprot:XP_013761609.1 2OG-Fe(II) oxygenase family Oxidoreductase [Thecamonas trahens ATCC 50062]